MIVRILSEGQWRLTMRRSDLNEFDAEVERAVRADDQEELSTALHRLLDRVRAKARGCPTRNSTTPT